MSVYYTFFAELDAQLSSPDLISILSQGQAIGCSYYESSSALSVHEDKKLSLKQATEYYLTQEQALDKPLALLTHNDGTYFFLMFSDHISLGLRVEIMLASHIWQRKFDGVAYKDFPRYLRLLLDMTDDFPLLDIGIERD